MQTYRKENRAPNDEVFSMKIAFCFSSLDRLEAFQAVALIKRLQNVYYIIYHI